MSRKAPSQLRAAEVAEAMLGEENWLDALMGEQSAPHDWHIENVATGEVKVVPDTGNTADVNQHLVDGQSYRFRRRRRVLPESRQNRFNPKGLSRARDGRLLDKWGRSMDMDWDEFDRRRIKVKDAGKPYPPAPAQQNPLHNTVTYDPTKQDSYLHDKRKSAEKLVGDMLDQGANI